MVVFQPAEEGGAGARAMIDDGLMTRFAIDEVYGMHNLPGLPVGQFATRAGPIMAAADRFEIEIEGRGGHAAMPHQAIDPVLVGAHIVTMAQTIVARNVDPLETCVVSVTVVPGRVGAERDPADRKARRHHPHPHARDAGLRRSAAEDASPRAWRRPMERRSASATRAAIR